MANGIQLSTNFDLKSALPLDDRLVVSNINDLNNLDNRYVGLTVYVTGENKYYYYNTNNAWVEFSSSQNLNNVVYTTGNQTISGLKDFATRPTVNGTEVLLNGESAIDDTETLSLFYTGPQFGDFLPKTYLPNNNKNIKRYINVSVGNLDFPIFVPTGNIQNGRTVYLKLEGSVPNGRFVISGVDGYTAQSPLRLSKIGEDIELTYFTISNSWFQTSRYLNNFVNTDSYQLVNSLKDFTIRPTVNGTGVLLQGEVLNELPDTIVYESGIGLSVNENETVYIPPFNGINTLNCQVALIYISSSGLLRLPTGIHNLYNDQEERLNIRFTGPNMAGGTFYIQEAEYTFVNGQSTHAGWKNIYETKVIPYNSVINLYRRGSNTSWFFSKNNFLVDLENKTQYFVNNTGNQSISGIKKFENSLIFGNGSGLFNQNGLDLGFRINIPSDSGAAISFMRGGNIPTPHSYGIVFEGGGIADKKGYLTAGSATVANSYNYATLDWVNRILSGQWKTNSRLLVNNVPVVLETVNINNITENFIFNSSFNSKLLTINATQNITGIVPSGLETGYNVSFVQMGNGQLFITGSGDVLVQQRLNLFRTAGKYGIASLLHHSGNQFILYGDLI